MNPDVISARFMLENWGKLESLRFVVSNMNNDVYGRVRCITMGKSGMMTIALTMSLCEKCIKSFNQHLGNQESDL